MNKLLQNDWGGDAVQYVHRNAIVYWLLSYYVWPGQSELWLQMNLNKK